MSEALFPQAVAFWVLYVALEPYVRRRWPQSLISKDRLLAGEFETRSWADTCWPESRWELDTLYTSGWRRSRSRQGGVAVNSPAALLGADSALGAWFQAIIHAITLAGVLLLVLSSSHRPAEKLASAAACFVAVTALLGFIQPGNRPLVFAFCAALRIGSVLYILIRWGVLPMSVEVSILVGRGSSFSDFRFLGVVPGMTIFALTMVLLPAAWSFRNALGARKLWREGFLARPKRAPSIANVPRTAGHRAECPNPVRPPGERARGRGLR